MMHGQTNTKFVIIPLCIILTL